MRWWPRGGRVAGLPGATGFTAAPAASPTPPLVLPTVRACSDEVELVYVREGDLRTVVNRRGGTFMNTLFDM